MLRKTKKATLFIPMIMCVMALLFVGCSKEKGEGTAGAEKMSESKPVDLVMGHPFSAQHPVSQRILIPLAEELAAKSDGRIKLTIHAGGSVTSPATIYEDVVSGAIDMGWTLQGYTPGKYPLSEALELPFQFESTLEASSTFWELFQRSEAL